MKKSIDKPLEPLVDSPRRGERGRNGTPRHSYLEEWPGIAIDFGHTFRPPARGSCGEFSRAAKYFRLACIRVHYSMNGSEDTILLVPAKSPFAPTWKTNRLIITWMETFRQIEELSNRVKPPLNLPVTSPFSRA
jgi:hypothetical protein